MLIVGTGALASFLAQHFFEAKLTFQLFGSPSSRLEQLQESYRSLGDDVAVTRAHEVRAHDIWIVAVKCWQNQAKVRALLEAPSPQVILVLQNGFCPELEWKALPHPWVERGLSNYGVRTVSPGKFVGGQRGEIVLSKDSKCLDFFARSDLRTHLTSNISTAVWHKLAVNASLNVVASLLDCPNGGVLETSSARKLVSSAASEVQEVALADGIDWGPKSAWEIVKDVILKTESNICSTLADLRSHRPTEYDAINAEVLKRGRELGVDLPVLRELDTKFGLLRLKSQQVTAISMATFRRSLPLLTDIRSDWVTPA